MTVSALVREFGYNNVSPAVRRMYDKGQYDKWVDVVNAIEPRTYRDPEKHDAMNMPYRSVYFESRNWDRYDGVLRESGFRQFPVLAARWNVTGGDIYGTGPGMEALGDLRQLQQEQFYKSKAIAMQADPAVVASADMRNQEANLVPGGVIYADNVAQVQGIRAAYEVNLRLDYLVQDLQDTRRRIDEAFYKDIFLMITGMPASQRATATEIAERHEEKMLMLGPVLERLNAELNDRLISMTFDRLLQVGLIPPVPQELEGVDLNVEFVSVLAQAQKAITTNAVDRFTQNLGQLANMKPEILDKFDADYWADYYSDVLGLDPRLIVPGKEVARIRQQRAEAQQQAQQLANAEQASAIAKNLGAAQQGQPIQGELRSAEPGEIYNQFSGY